MDMSRAVLLEQLHRLLADICATSLEELCRKGEYAADPSLRYPQTKGEYLADSLSSLLASQSWIDGESEPALDELLGIVGQLDQDVAQPEVWQELLALADDPSLK